jgi:N-methylhydantoinase A
MAGVVIPPHSGVFSALGLLLSPPRADVARSVMLAETEREQLDAVITELRDTAAARLAATSGVTAESTVALVDTRYRGQAHEISVPCDPGDGWERLAVRFHHLHAERNGFARPTDPIEAVTVRAEAIGRPLLRWSDISELAPRGPAHRPRRPVLTPEGEVDAAVWWRPGLAAGAEVIGPAVVEEIDATTYLGAGERAVVLSGGALEVEW